jgi:hypothetical protein
VFEIHITENSTCLDVVGEIKGLLDLGSNSVHDYRVFLQLPNGSFSRLENNLLVHTSMLHWEQQWAAPKTSIKGGSGGGGGNHGGGKFGGSGGGGSGGDIGSTIDDEAPDRFKFKFNIFAFSGITQDLSLAEQDFELERVRRQFLPVSFHFHAAHFHAMPPFAT